MGTAIVCELYRSWASRLSVTMRQVHAGGDKLFIDHAGDTVPVIIGRLTGQLARRRFLSLSWALPAEPRNLRLITRILR
jgi:transposase